MLDRRVVGEGHEKFKKLSALANSHSLAPAELSELYVHLQGCAECREVFNEYSALDRGLTDLTAPGGNSPSFMSWDQESARKRLMSRVYADQTGTRQDQAQVLGSSRAGRFWWRKSTTAARVAVAAGLVMAVSYGTYYLGRASGRRNAMPTPASASTSAPADCSLPKSLGGNVALNSLIDSQTQQLGRLKEQNSQKEEEISRLQAALRAVDSRLNQLSDANAQSETRIRDLASQRDTLNAQLQAATQAYANSKLELANLRAERDKTILRTSSLEAQNSELSAANRDQERRLRDSEQYLSSDRDIRELMGARQLYIADVFDVDGNSRTQRPFGRVFYTQGKSLIFYAFDLDREPGVVNASTFQVWGQRQTPEGQQALPTNLGILYMDNETNRRWVMRFDDPKRLAEIDAVFVTVEPRGGSHKPTGKPFLYALLRKEANHP